MKFAWLQKNPDVNLSGLGMKMLKARWWMFGVFWMAVSAYAFWMFYQAALYVAAESEEEATTLAVSLKKPGTKKLLESLEARRKNLQIAQTREYEDLFNFSVEEKAVWQAATRDNGVNVAGSVPDRPGGWN